MFRDAKEELARLESELLAAEADLPQQEALLQDGEPGELDSAIDNILSEAPPAEHPGAYINFANGYGSHVYNADTADVELEDYSKQVMKPPKERLTGLWVLLLILLVGNLCVMGFWILRFLGVLG